MPTKVLQLVSVGAIPPSLLQDLEEPIRLQLGASLVPSLKALPTPGYAFNKDRNQYHSTAIMRRLAQLPEPGQTLLGVLDEDLFLPDSPFIFGESDREAHIGLLAIGRLKQGTDYEGFRHRLQVEGLHQAGHLVGLSYCEDQRCVMSLSQSVKEVDKKHATLCHVCRNELAKIMR
jgi:archaemetzincin